MQTKDLVRDGNSTVQKSLAISLVAGAILTANAGVSADGTVATTSQSTTEVIPASDTPTASDTPKTEEKLEVKPSEEVPTTPSDTPAVPDAPKTEEKPEVKPSEEVPTTPSDTPAVPDAPKTEEKPEVKPSEEVPEKPKPAVYVPKPYENGTGSETVLHPQVTGTPTVTPTNNEPVITDEGYKIVDIAKSILTLENADGSRIQVKPELIGGVTNEDGTVTIKNSKGGLETLPETGLVESMLMTLIGFLLLFFAFSLVNKRNQNVYTYL
jgi:outer membrane biosynthesis protein TonB